MKYLGFVLLVLSGCVMAEEVYYCIDNGVNGFTKRGGQYQQQNFRNNKFKMKLQDDGNITILSDDGYTWSYSCLSPYRYSSDFELNQKYKDMKSCVHESHIGYYFNFNPDKGRYVLFKGLGYVFGDGDSVVTKIGTCTKF